VYVCEVNSPDRILDPILLKFMSNTYRFVNGGRIIQDKPSVFDFTDGEPRQRNQNLGVKRYDPGEAAGALTGIASAAALVNPALLPVAAAGGIGYGVYRLGQSFKLW
jgi:hypothetical protein